MKAEIHPDYHEITVAMTNGTKFTTRSTYGAAGDTLTLDVDPSTHPAWNKDNTGALRKAKQIDKFAQKFGNFDFANTKK